MNKRLLCVLLAMTIAAVALAAGQSKTDCPAKASSAKNSTCCVNGAKAVQTSNKTENSQDPKSAAACQTSSKQCADHAKMTKNESTADPAHCDMTKASTMDCCKKGMKTSEAKNTLKKSPTTKAKVAKASTETKGTD